MRAVKRIISFLLSIGRGLLDRRVIRKSSFDTSKLDFMHSYFYGNGERQITDEHRIWADASITFVVEIHGSICGVVGGHLYGNKFSVRQLQGVRGANFRGVDSGGYLLDCAEEIAKTLGLESVSVRAYTMPEEIPEDEGEIKLCLRKAKIYNQTPKARGYTNQLSLMGRLDREFFLQGEFKPRTEAVTT